MAVANDVRTMSSLVIAPEDQSRHGVHFYGANERQLIENLGAYVSDALLSGGGALIVATAAHSTALAGQLNRACIDPAQSVRERRLAFVDARNTLDRFMLDSQPDWPMFERTVRNAFRGIHARRRPGGHTGICVYGEMVGLLWQMGQTSAAIQLEHFWNRLLESITFDLLCGYPIAASDDEDVRAIVCAHTHVVPGETE